jgi:hypothetical protein
MTVTALAPRTGTTPVAEMLACVHALLDDVLGSGALLAGRADAGLLVDGGAGLLVSVDRAIARLQGVRLSLVAAADRAGVASSTGMTGTPAWLASASRAHGSTAARDVNLAVALEESLPVTRAALAEGSVSAEHAAVIAHATGQLPAELTTEQRAQVEASLVSSARHLDPARLRRVARTALAFAGRDADAVRAHHDQVLRTQEQAARQVARFTLHDHHDGTTSGHFRVPTLEAEILRKVLQQMTAPRRQHDHNPTTTIAATSTTGSRTSGSGGGGSGGGSDDGAVDWPHRYGLAFSDLIARIPTDHLHHKSAATIVVTIDHATLTHQLDQVGPHASGIASTDTGHEMSAAQARRIACSAGILPAILDGPSLPLDLGRTRRFFTEAQRIALATQYETCATDGCDRPYAWTELHHQDPWARGGHTNLAKAVPLCSWHHHRAHDPTHLHSVHTHPDGMKTLTFHRRT